MQDILLVVVIIGHLVVCPYTKVEESFSLQAMHDILFHQHNISQYDHQEFPGVVPRTFLGPLVVSTLSSPLFFVAQHFSANKMFAQYIVRAVLGFLVAYSFLQYKRAVDKNIGRRVARWMTVLTLTQFHFIFYATRPLPNTFTLIIVMMAVKWWLEQKHSYFLWSSMLAIFVFRFELCLFLGIMILMELVSGRLSLLKASIHSVSAIVFWLGLSVMVDSWFWQRWLWPEGDSMYFNLILNKSSAYGTSPFLWYFYSALPRALGASFIFTIFGAFLDRRSLTLLIPAVGFITLFSILPHKELRFIVYTFPIFNTVAAMACSIISSNWRKSAFYKFFTLVIIGHLFVNILMSSFLLYVSHMNYPGGIAMKQLHTHLSHENGINLHIDVTAAQTGVSRFTQTRPDWIYNKTENLLPGGRDMMQFTHLLIGVSSDENEVQPYSSTHEVLSKVQAFSHLTMQLNSWPPISIVKKPAIYILQKIY